MRLDYFCPVYVETGSGKALTDPRKLKKLAGQIDRDPDSELTQYMDEVLSNRLIFDPVRLVFNEEENALFARVGFHEKEELSTKELDQLTEFVIGQFSDGYGEGTWSFRKGLSSNKVHFVSYDLKPSVLDYQQTEFVPYPVQSDSQVSLHSLVRGPFQTIADIPKPKPITATPDKAIHKLHLAAMEGDLDQVKAVLGKGVNPDSRPAKTEPHEPDYTALCWASNRGQIEIAQYLIFQGADLDFQAQSGTPLMAACTLDMIELLLNAGADTKVTVNNMTAAEYHRNQASFYLDHDHGLTQEWMENRGKEILALAECIENGQ